MINVKARVAYDGTRYYGWQKTKTGPSIEETLARAIGQIVQHKVELQAASRTDRGVHARGQVVQFHMRPAKELARIQRGINALLPPDISLYDLTPASESFHPTLHALGKRYRYHICNGRVQLPFHQHTSWHIPYPLRQDHMERAKGILIGHHDFAAFRNVARSAQTHCVVQDIAIHPLAGQRLCIEIIADRFLYKMVRILVGTLLYVGCGKLSAAQVPEILHSKQRCLAGITAPAHGLCLQEVMYAMA